MSETDLEWGKTSRLMHARRRKKFHPKVDHRALGGLCDYRLFDLRGRLILMEFYSPGQRAASQIPLLRPREDNRKVPLWARYSEDILSPSVLRI